MTEIDLNLLKRAKRAVKRKNIDIKRRYPLFVDQFATNESEQIERLTQIDKRNKEHFARMAEFE